MSSSAPSSLILDLLATLNSLLDQFKFMSRNGGSFVLRIQGEKPDFFLVPGELVVPRHLPAFSLLISELDAPKCTFRVVFSPSDGRPTKGFRLDCLVNRDFRETD